jgi:hypothetical protein
MSNKGIDYGMGQTNIDRETGIRFGVIPMNALGEYAWDGFEPDYGPPSCPECGREVKEYDDEAHGEYPEIRGCADYACESCERVYDSEKVYGDEPCGHTCTDSEYSATVDSYNDVFILKSPYYTRAQFCSPCAPGACYLTNPCEDGAKAYCLGEEWFNDESSCPYPIYRVDNDELLYSPKETESSDE